MKFQPTLSEITVGIACAVAIDAAAEGSIPGNAARPAHVALSEDEIDRRCIQEVLSGRKDSFHLILARYQARVYRFLLRHVQQSDDAMDLTQEAFVQAYLKLPTWRSEGKFSTWLIGIALNLARNHANRSPHLRHVHSELDENDGAVAACSGQDPEQAFIETARHAALLAALEQLPTELREPLVLVAVEGVPYEEVAQLLAVPIGTLKSRLNRGRRLLRQTLGAHI